MDERTIASYELNAETIFQRHISHGRSRMNDRILRWFHPGQPTADIGSGSGINLDWLVANGFPAIGYEPVAALRRLSIEAYPTIDVRNDALPDLTTIATAAFANVLCSAVLMHVPAEAIPSAVTNLVRILRPNGRLLLTFRNGHQGQEREADDRLFTPLDIDTIANLVEATNATVEEQLTESDPDRPGVQWSVILATNKS